MRNQCVTAAIYDAGFNSSGRFYEKSTSMLGMLPTRYRADGAPSGYAWGVERKRQLIAARLGRSAPRRPPARAAPFNKE